MVGGKLLLFSLADNSFLPAPQCAGGESRLQLCWLCAGERELLIGSETKPEVLIRRTFQQRFPSNMIG